MWENDRLRGISKGFDKQTLVNFINGSNLVFYFALGDWEQTKTSRGGTGQMIEWSTYNNTEPTKTT